VSGIDFPKRQMRIQYPHVNGCSMVPNVFQVDNAIILAAGFGSRFVPITYETPKGLISVRGEPLLERQVRQLKEKGVSEIIIVVGYLKEKFDYLIDKFGVQLVFNPEYASKNNLASLYYARGYLKNTYILCADNWLEENIFNSVEQKSWYSCVYKIGPTAEWCVKTDNTERISDVTIGGHDSWVMYGPVFLSQPFSDSFINKIEEYYNKPGTEDYMWENVFIDEIRHFALYINKQQDNVYEFETLEELRQFDPDYRKGTSNVVIKHIETTFNVNEKEIANIRNQKVGMTNRSFTFSISNKSYIFRFPGEGTDKLINRSQEYETYKAIKNLNISDEIVYFDQNTGNKISTFYKGALNTDANNQEDIRASMDILRTIHRSGIQVNHSFDIEQEILRYLTLCNEQKVLKFMDNEEIPKKMKRLIAFAKRMNVPRVLCHIDSNPDNFIRLKDNTVKLVDWEYAGMGDPIIDVSMYAIYSGFSKSKMDWLLRIYLQRKPCMNETVRLYIYAALGGYLWALWTEYKQSLGIEFGDYGTRMYQYAKNYYNYLEQGVLIK